MPCDYSLSAAKERARNEAIKLLAQAILDGRVIVHYDKVVTKKVTLKEAPKLYGQKKTDAKKFLEAVRKCGWTDGCVLTRLRTDSAIQVAVRNHVEGIAKEAEKEGVVIHGH